MDVRHLSPRRMFHVDKQYEHFIFLEKFIKKVSDISSNQDFLRFSYCNYYSVSKPCHVERISKSVLDESGDSSYIQRMSDGAFQPSDILVIYAFRAKRQTQKTCQTLSINNSLSSAFSTPSAYFFQKVTRNIQFLTC